jgi:hypothetical protein
LEETGWKKRMRGSIWRMISRILPTAEPVMSNE